jgi:hypothetical protein
MTPEMLRTLSRTWTHLCAKTLVRHAPTSTPAVPVFEPLEPTEAVTILKDPVVAAVEARVNRLALTGDVLATQMACQEWAHAVKKACSRLEELAHAPRD